MTCRCRASVMLLLVGLVGGCTSSVPAESSSVPIVATAVTVASTTLPPETVAETTTTTAEMTTTEGPKTFDSGTFQVAFTILPPEETVLKRGGIYDKYYELVHVSNPNVGVLIVAGGASSSAAWVNATSDHLEVTDEIDTVVGELPATYVDFTADKRGPIPGVLGWSIEKGDVGRVYFVEGDGVAVQIIAASTPDLWEGFLPEFEALVAGITWG